MKSCSIYFCLSLNEEALMPLGLVLCFLVRQNQWPPACLKESMDERPPGLSHRCHMSQVQRPQCLHHGHVVLLCPTNLLLLQTNKRTGHGFPPLLRWFFVGFPRTGVDPESRRCMWKLISSTMLGRAVILTTHSMEECEALCSRLLE